MPRLGLMVPVLLTRMMFTVATGSDVRSCKETSWTWRPVDSELPQPVTAAEATKYLTASSVGARSSHGVSVVNSKLYLMGGELVARTPVDSTIWERNLDEEGAEWKVVEATGDLAPPPRVAHSQADIGNALYIFGGRQGITMDEAPLNDLWRFSLDDRAWTPLEAAHGLPPTNRSFHKMTSLGDKLYVFGGCGVTGRLADLHCFDPATDTWSHLADAAEGMAGRGGAGFVASSDGKSLFVVGGFVGDESSGIWRFDLESKKWASVIPEGNDKIRPFSVSAGASVGGKLVFFGGEVGPSGRGHEGAGDFSDDVLILDGSTGLPVQTKGSLSAAPIARGWASADAFGEDKMVIYGGLTGNDESPARLADTWVLQFDS